MRNQVLTLVATVSSLSTITARADRDVGNGGDVVVCEVANSQPTIELLDVFEARRLGLNLDFGPSDLNLAERVKFVLQRLETHDRARLQYYLDELSSFFVADLWRQDSAEIQIDTILEDIPDEAGYRSIPNGCHIEQIVIQSLSPLPGQKRFTIDDELWSGLSTDNQVALIVHELLFADALYNRSAKSWQVRHLNGQMLRKDFNSFSAEVYANLLKLTGFDQNAIRNGTIWLENSHIEFDANGSIAAGNLSPKQNGIAIKNTAQESFKFSFTKPIRATFFPNNVLAKLIVPNLVYTDYAEIAFDRLNECDFSAAISDSTIEFHPNGALAELHSVSHSAYAKGTLCIGEELIKIQHQSSFYFHDNGTVAKFDGPLKATINSNLVSLRGAIEFHPSGRVKSGTLDESYLLKTTKMDSRWYHEGSWIHFNETGLVLLP